MTRPVARIGDLCTGHENWPPRPAVGGSGDVFVNSIGVHREGDGWAVHCNSKPQCHDSILDEGSSTVFVNNLEVGRIGDPVACGSAVAQGSPNVFFGG